MFRRYAEERSLDLTVSSSREMTMASGNEDDQVTQQTRHLETTMEMTGASSTGRGMRAPSRGPKNRTSGRLWQLPQSSIQEYATWIEQKPEEAQTQNEQRFLQKFQRRMVVRRNKAPKESMKHYIARLEAKDNVSDVEMKLIEQYHRRKAQRRLRRFRREHNPFRGNSIVMPPPPPIFWRRETSSKQQQHSSSTSSSPSMSPTAVPLLSSMANLQERMDRMGLSTEKLRDMPMEDTNGESSSRRTTLFQSYPYPTPATEQTPHQR